MKSTLTLSLCLTVSATTLLLAGCGGGSSGDSSSGTGSTTASGSATTTGSTGGTGTIPNTGTTGTTGSTSSTGTTGGTGTATPTMQQRINAATSTASDNALCTSITPFYWEIGDGTGTKVSGTGGTGALPPPTAKTNMLIASASKWLFSTYVAQQRQGALTASDIKFLNFESGYTNLNACDSSDTVSSCLGEPGNLPNSTNGQYVAVTDGKFFYNGGHMQVLASTMAIGPDANAQLTSDMQAVLGNNLAFSYDDPQMAGGAIASGTIYAQFLRNMLNAQYSYMLPLLGSNPVCTHTNSSDCPTAMYSPVNQSGPGEPNNVSNEAWHYSVGHWVEDDPLVGDGSFSSPGRYGFYPWIDQSKTYYGVLARFDPTHVDPVDPTQAAYFTSVECGRTIRKAWLSGQAQ